jgi:hypothetical protein
LNAVAAESAVVPVKPKPVEMSPVPNMANGAAGPIVVSRVVKDLSIAHVNVSMAHVMSPSRRPAGAIMVVLAVDALIHGISHGHVVML